MKLTLNSIKILIQNFYRLYLIYKFYKYIKKIECLAVYPTSLYYSTYIII